jgi:hypothetical protein
MNTIHKAQLFACREQLITMPVDAQIVAVQPQDGKIAIWYYTKDQDVKSQRLFFCASSGDDLGEFISAEDYVGTCQFHSGRTVVHVFGGKP